MDSVDDVAMCNFFKVRVFLRVDGCRFRRNSFFAYGFLDIVFVLPKQFSFFFIWH